MKRNTVRKLQYPRNSGVLDARNAAQSLFRRLALRLRSTAHQPDACPPRPSRKSRFGPPLRAACSGNREGFKKDQSHDHNVSHPQENRPRTNLLADRRLAQEIGRAKSLLPLLSLLSRTSTGLVPMLGKRPTNCSEWCELDRKPTLTPVWQPAF